MITIGIEETCHSLNDIILVLGDMFPHPSAWPFVAYPGFTQLTTTARYPRINLIPIIGFPVHSFSSILKLCMCSALSGAYAWAFTPYVEPSQVADWEDFAYSFYDNHTELYRFNQTAISSFGRGIFKIDARSGTPDYRVHDTTGDTSWNSPKKYLAPSLQYTVPSQPFEAMNEGLMLNTRFNDVLCSNAHDRIIECAENRTSLNETCAVLTGLNALTRGADPYPRAYVIQPIFASKGDPNKVVGFVAAFLHFNDLLLSNIPPDTHEIEYVVNVNHVILTYRIRDATPVFIGLGDLHDGRYEDHKKSVNIVDKLGNIEHCAEMVYTIDFYPTDEYKHPFETNLRWIFCFGSVALIMLVSIIFAAYDHFMVRENTEQQAVLETKRQFVRFISHEVRTPLNAVSMAGDLLKDQVCTLYLHIVEQKYLCFLFCGSTLFFSVQTGYNLRLPAFYFSNMQHCFVLIYR